MLHALKRMGVDSVVDRRLRHRRYSSLAYLKLFPTTTLKIDRSFVRRHRGATRTMPAIAVSTIALAHSLGLR